MLHELGARAASLAQRLDQRIGQRSWSSDTSVEALDQIRLELGLLRGAMQSIDNLQRRRLIKQTDAAFACIVAYFDEKLEACLDGAVGLHEGIRPATRTRAVDSCELRQRILAHLEGETNSCEGEGETTHRPVVDESRPSGNIMLTGIVARHNARPSSTTSMEERLESRPSSTDTDRTRWRPAPLALDGEGVSPAAGASPLEIAVAMRNQLRFAVERRPSLVRERSASLDALSPLDAAEIHPASEDRPGIPPQSRRSPPSGAPAVNLTLDHSQAQQRPPRSPAAPAEVVRAGGSSPVVAASRWPAAVGGCSVAQRRAAPAQRSGSSSSAGPCLARRGSANSAGALEMTIDPRTSPTAGQQPRTHHASPSTPARPRTASHAQRSRGGGHGFGRGGGAVATRPGAGALGERGGRSNSTGSIRRPPTPLRGPTTLGWRPPTTPPTPPITPVPVRRHSSPMVARTPSGRDAWLHEQYHNMMAFGGAGARMAFSPAPRRRPEVGGILPGGGPASSSGSPGAVVVAPPAAEETTPARTRAVGSRSSGASDRAGGRMLAGGLEPAPEPEEPAQAARPVRPTSASRPSTGDTASTFLERGGAEPEREPETNEVPTTLPAGERYRRTLYDTSRSMAEVLGFGQPTANFYAANV